MFDHLLCVLSCLSIQALSLFAWFFILHLALTLWMILKLFNLYLERLLLSCCYYTACSFSDLVQGVKKVLDFYIFFQTLIKSELLPKPRQWLL